MSFYHSVSLRTMKCLIICLVIAFTLVIGGCSESKEASNAASYPAARKTVVHELPSLHGPIKTSGQLK
jgi:hypothetical protein